MSKNKYTVTITDNLSKVIEDYQDIYKARHERLISKDRVMGLLLNFGIIGLIELGDELKIETETIKKLNRKHEI